MSLKPDSLFGRLICVLFAGLLLVLMVTLLVNMDERDDLISRSAGRQAVGRIADTVKLLDQSEPAERQNIIRIINVPPQQVLLKSTPLIMNSDTAEDVVLMHFASALKQELGEDTKVMVEHITMAQSINMREDQTVQPYGSMRGMRHGRRHNVYTGMDAQEERFIPGRYRGQNTSANDVNIVSFLVQVQLQDGQWVVFDTSTTRDASVWSWRLLFSMLLLFAAVMVISYIAVRWLTKPLKQLAHAAEALGRDINQTPLPETGPKEIRQASQAFNTMQQRLKHYIQDRTHIFAAMSHDLKTPITRLRLRAEMLGDEEGNQLLRQRFEQDLIEMEAMVSQTLDFMKGLDNHEARQLIDVNALLETLQEDYLECGKVVSIEGRVIQPFYGVLSLLKRCLTNLLDNAIFYGNEAHIFVSDNDHYLEIYIRDKGPGIDAVEMDRVFDPFYRIEHSRNRATGGSGLGLTIARNIAQAHGGDVFLANHSEGGLVAVVRLRKN